MNISSNQVAALCFALTEGRVSSGCDAMAAGKRVKVGARTVAALIRRGWLVPAYGGAADDYQLSETGRAAGNVAFHADRGYDWNPARSSAR